MIEMFQLEWFDTSVLVRYIVGVTILLLIGLKKCNLPEYLAKDRLEWGEIELMELNSVETRLW